MIRLSKISDLDSIMKIVAGTIEIMCRENNPQWDKNYPNRFDFLEDIKSNDLYIYEIHKEIRGLICLNTIEPEEYQALTWSLPDTAVVLHRMTVNPKYRRQGIGTILINYAETFALERRYKYLKTDTYSFNQNMNYLFVRQGYRKMGEIYLNQKPETFNCYEKILIHK